MHDYFGKRVSVGFILHCFIVSKTVEGHVFFSQFASHVMQHIFQFSLFYSVGIEITSIS